MKKVLLSFIACNVMFMGFSQNPFPCVKYYSTGNLGGGDCQTKGSGNGKHYPGYLTVPENINYFPTGKITVYFESPIPVGTPAPVITAAGIDSSAHIKFPAFDYKYAAYNDNISIARSSVVYCYHGSASNQNIFNGSRAPLLAFEIFYPSNTDTTQTCGGVTLPSTLPVSFKSFTAARNSQSVAVRWETATEQNNRGFYVQRNVNGEWKDVAFVFSSAEGGNSDRILSYAYNDANNLNSISYYRILQVDLDGRGKYSEVRTVKGLGQQSKLMLFPNPGTSGKISVQLGDETSSKNIIVYDATGRVVKSFRNVIDNNLSIDQLKPGMYNIQVTNLASQTTSSDKFIIKD